MVSGYPLTRIFLPDHFRTAHVTAEPVSIADNGVGGAAGSLIVVRIEYPPEGCADANT